MPARGEGRECACLFEWLAQQAEERNQWMTTPCLRRSGSFDLRGWR
jgi:hypothetical protein